MAWGLPRSPLCRRWWHLAVPLVLGAACATPPLLVPPVSPPISDTLAGRPESSVTDDGLAPGLIRGNDARLLVDGPQTYAAMLRAIGAARDHIHVETYILEPRQPLSGLLLAKRAEGVRVHVLYDSVGSIGTPGEYFADLAAGGIVLCEFNPVNPLKADNGLNLNNRGHRKVLIVDGRVAFTGGINLSRVYSTGSFRRRTLSPNKAEEGWRDTHVEVRGPVVAEFQRIFMDSWQRQKCPPMAAVDVFPSLHAAGDKAMHMAVADPEQAQSEFYVALLLAIVNAHHRIWLTYGYFVPDRRILDALKEAARRDVDVRLVLPGFSDFWAPFHAGRFRYGELLDAGVRIFERRDALLHAKTAVIDSVWSSVGSTNLDWRSFVSNYEADLIVLDRDFAGRMEALFQLDQAASHEIGRAEWGRRGLLNRLKEWFARCWERLL